MGMIVDEHIKILKSYHNGFTGYVSNIQDSIDVAVDIMCKYQKIQKIVDKWHHDIEAKDFECMAEIADVVEDEE